MEEINQSPVITKKEEPKTLSFPMAIQEVIEGKRITRIEWNNNHYGFLNSGFLSLFRDGKVHQWLVNEGDMLATDWISLPALN
jgi:hypothetical protein